MAPRNIIILLIICGLIGGVLGYHTETANAAAIIGDPWQFLKQFVIFPLVRMIANSLENKIVNSINKQVSNINGKAPGYITNWRNHFLDSQARGNDVFRSVLADTKSCSYFDKNLKTAFGAEKYIGSIAGATTKNSAGQVVYQNKTGIPGLPSFQNLANCTLPANLNINTFRTDFAKGGGWDTWNKLIQPQNNFFGAYSLALGEQQRQIATEEKTTMDSAVAGQGFLSQKLGIGTSGLGPSGCVGKGISSSETASTTCTNQCKNSYNSCVKTGGPICATELQSCNSTCSALLTNAGSNTRCAFFGKDVTPAQILGKTAAAAIDKKLGRPGAASELTDIVLSMFSAVLNATLNRVANYIAQNTYDQPPATPDPFTPATGFNEQQFQPGAGDPNFDSETDSMYQNVRRSCMDSCSSDCESSAPQECTTDPVTGEERCTKDQGAVDTCRQNCDPQCDDRVPEPGI